MVEKLKSHRLEGIGEYYFSQKLREIENLNAQGHSVLNLGIGSPDMKPPPEALHALSEALNEPNANQYQSYKGLPELRATYAGWYQHHFGANLDPDKEILPLIGSKEGIMHASMALLNKGDLVLVPDPGYPTYAAATKLAGGEIVHYPLVESNGYYPDFEALEQQDLSKVKIMWVNYPHMPTGTDADEGIFEALLDFSQKHGIVIINDNPYGFILTEKRQSILEKRRPSDLVLELNSLSKSHNMSGWRVGVIAGNAELIQVILTFKSNMDSGQFKPIMRAAIAGLQVADQWYIDQNNRYRERREAVFQIAELLGCTFRKEQVGMFVWTKIPEEQLDGESYADYLLEKYRIFIPPGSVFGSQGDQHIRFSLCSDLPVWQEVLDRIKKVS